MSEAFNTLGEEQMPEPHDLLLRSFTSIEADNRKVRKRRPHSPEAGPSRWTLVFDTETGTDHAQNLRFGAYEIRESGKLHERGLFFEAAHLSGEEVGTLQAYGAKQDIPCRPKAEFVDEVLYRYGFEFRAAIVGFNLPFDLSRLAVRYGAARGNMRGGFTFQVSSDPYRPRIRVKHLSRRASLIDFAGTKKRQDNRRTRREGGAGKIFRGYFVDIRTAAAALTSRSHTLKTLAQSLGLSVQKAETDEHGSRLTTDYIAYALQDVAATWACYEALRAKFAQHNLSKAHLHRILSEAGLGKACLKEMNIRPWRQVQPDFPKEMLGVIMGTYFGGRTEVKLRRQIGQVLYADFLSMYPTVCTLMGLWSFVIANGVTWHDATQDTRTFVESCDLEALRNRITWKGLTTLVCIQPNDDVLPVRTRYGGAQQATIGLNHLTSGEGLWFTLADCLASKVLTGKAPKVLLAMRFTPKAPQADLQSICIAGNADYRIDPTKDDLFARVIDMRTGVKDRMIGAGPEERARLNDEQQTLKILANSTSYGIFVELIVEELEEAQDVRCYPPNGQPFDVLTKKLERPGSFFHPLIGTLITGAARLMLALAECLVIQAGLGWAFCDTDSMAITKPDGLSEEEFLSRAQGITDWFTMLNPYSSKGPIFKIEKENLSPEGSRYERLFCLAISSKRYVLFNLGDDGLPFIRKASAHGLGHLMAPYETSVVLTGRTDAVAILKAADVEAWQYDLWFKIILAALNGKPEGVARDYHPALKRPAISRYGATTPDLLRLFQHFNRLRDFREQVKPFNFLISLFADPITFGDALPNFPPDAPKGKGVKFNSLPVYPIAPFDRDPERVAATAFDRVTGGPVPKGSLKTYARLLVNYHLSPEPKFENGDYCDQGMTFRRHIAHAATRYIGKEANRWEEQMFVPRLDAANIDYGAGENGVSLQIAELGKFAAKFGRREASVIAGLSRGTIDRLLNSPDIPIGKRTAGKLANGLEKLRNMAISVELEDRALRQSLNSRIEEMGLKALAAELGFDRSNLRKIARGDREISVGLRKRLAKTFSLPKLPSTDAQQDSKIQGPACPV